MKRLADIGKKALFSKIYLWGIVLLVQMLCLAPDNAVAYRVSGGCGSQNRINVDNNLSEDEKTTINEIYAAQYKLCETQEKIAHKLGKEHNLGAFSGITGFFGGLSQKEKEALQAADLLQSETKLDGKDLNNSETLQALKYLEKNYPDDYKALISDLNSVTEYKIKTPDLYKKAAEVSTDALRNSTIPLFAELSQHSNMSSSIGAEAANIASKNKRDNAFANTVDNMKKAGKSQEEIDKYIQDAVAVDGILSAQQSFGLTGAQSRKKIHDSQDRTAQVIAGCNISDMQKQYQSKCYSCIIIKTLMETFLNACSKAYDVTSEAGVKLLTLGALIWVAFFVIKNVSSLSSIEPGAMMNSLTVFLFKVMVAYILITSGLGVLIKYTINPLLTAGADFGIAFMNITSDMSNATELNSAYTVAVPTISSPKSDTATEIVSADVMNRIMLLAQNLDKNVSTNLVIGHAMTCWSMTGGAWDFYVFKMTNLWLWCCGALIWFVGFMLTLGIGYYLLDMSFKLGFAIMALPVVIGLWPFNMTKDKLSAVIGIMLKAAGTFVFLALTTTYALALINVALRDVPTLFEKIEQGESNWISETFDLTGSNFLIILFVYLYSMKLISSTVSDYVGKFFSDGVFGNASPMHGMLTQMTDFAKQQAMRPVKWAGGKASSAIAKRATAASIKLGQYFRGKNKS